MSREIIRVETDEEMKIYKQMTSYAFAPTPKVSKWSEFELPQTDFLKNSIRYLMYDEEIPTSSLHSIFMTQNVRGKIFDMQGIAGVSTYPEHRKKGYVRELMERALRDGYENGQVVSTLYPFRQSFYGKFGYINFPHAREMTMKPSDLRDISNFNIKGSIKRYLVSEQIERYYSFLEKYQKLHHGFALFDIQKEQQMEEKKYWIVFAVVEGEDQGMALFSTKGFEKEMQIPLFLYTNSMGKYLLLDHLRRHDDQFSELNLRLLPHEQPELWFYDSKMHLESRDWVPSPMGRVLDVSQLSGITGGDGAISIRVQDEHCTWNNNNFQLQGTDGRLDIEIVETHDIEMSIQAFSALVFGVYDLDDFFIRGWINKRDKNQILTSLFPPVNPSIWALF